MARLVKVFVIAIAFCGAMSTEPAYGGTVGEHVVVGDVTFIHDGYRTIIQASDGSIINYIRFDVLPWETIQFIQPDQWSRVLNRITGPDPSVIAGRIESNGQVYIVNPAGVYFANGATVDVGSLYAAAGNISDADFTSNVDRFTGLTGEVVNSGTINGRDVHLMGNRVANHGLINSGGGIITMLAGDQVHMTRLGERISVQVDGQELMNRSMPYGGGGMPDMTATAGVENTGVVRNTAGTVLFGAGDMYSLAIRNTGVVEAAGGNITLAATSGLVQNDGLLDASVVSGDAGSVVVQGPSVLNRGTVRADSQNGQAGYVELTSANHTFLTDGSHVSAAGGSGYAHAGEVLVHSYEGQTIFTRGATLDISGGLAGGAGGFAEVSGSNLIYLGVADLSAVNGEQQGTLLLDPAEILIQIGGPDPLPGTGIINFGDMAGATTIIDPSAFAAFGAGQMIILEATDLISINDGFTTLADLTLRTMNGQIRFQAAINVNSLVADSMGGVIRFFMNGAVTTAAGQSYMSNVEIGNGVGTVLTNTGAGRVVFNGTIETQGVPIAPNSLTVNGDASFFGDVGPLQGISSLTVTGNAIVGALGAGTPITIKTFQNQSYGSLTINRDAVFQSTLNGMISTGAIANSGGAGTDLTFLTGGTTALGTVGSAANAFNTIMTDGPGTVQIGGDMWGSSITLNDAAVLTADATLNGVGPAGNVLFGSTVTSLGIPRNLTVNAQTTQFSGDISNLGTLTTDAAGMTTVNAGMVTAGTLNFNDTLVLGADSTMNGTTATNFAAINGNGNDLTVNSPMTAFTGNVTGIGTLMTDAAGTTTVSGDVSGAVLDFNDMVALGGNSTMTGTTSVDFAQTIAGGGNNLTVNSPVTGFNGNIAGVGTLMTDAAGTTTIGGDVAGAIIDFNDMVALAATSTITGTTSIDFANGLAGNTNNLTLNSPITGLNGVFGNLGTLQTDGAGTTTIAGLVQGAVLDFNDAVTLGGATALTGTTSVDFAQAITGAGNDLTVNSPMTGFNGAVNNVGTLMTDAAGTTTISGDITGTVLDFNDNVALGGNAALTGTTSVDFAQAIAGNNNNLTVNSPVTGFNGNIAGVGVLATDAAGTTTLGAGLTSVQAQTVTFNDGLMLLGPNAKAIVASAGDATFNGINGAGNNLTITGNEVRLIGAVNGINEFTVSALGGANRIFLTDAPVTTTGNQRYNGNMRFETAGANPVTTLMGPQVTFNGLVDSQGVAAMPSGLRVAGNAVFMNNVGSLFGGILSLEVTGTSMFQAGVASVRSATTQLYGGGVTVSSPLLTMSSVGNGDITFNGTLNAGPVGIPGALVVNTGGQTIFNGVVGGTSALGSILTDAPGSTTVGANMTAGAITLADAVMLSNSAILTGNAGPVMFGSTIAGNGNSLTVNANQTTFGGNVSGVNVLMTDAAGTTTVNDGVSVQATDIAFNDAMTILNNNSSLLATRVNIAGATTVNGMSTVTGTQIVDFGGAINSGALAGALAVNSNQRVNFRGDIGTGTALNSLVVTTAGNGTDNEVVFFGNRSVVTNGGDIIFNSTGRATPSQVASIASTGSLLLNATGGGDVFMGLNEKLTTIGDLTINGTMATVGDLNSGGNIGINAGTIQIWRRPGGAIISASGALVTDIGSDIVAFGNLNLSTAPTFIGTGSNPLAAIGGSATNAGGLFVQGLTSASGMALMNAAGTLLDLSVLAGGTSLAEAFEEGEPTLISDRTPRDIVRMQALERLGFRLRPLSERELIDSTDGALVYVDMPITGLQREPDLSTLAARLDPRYVTRVADQFAMLFYDQRIDPETGEMTIENRDPLIQSMIADAWTEYQAAGTGESFRVWLEDSGKHSECLACLDDLRALFRDVELMGATQREQSLCMKQVCGDISPADMPASDLMSAIRSRTTG